ncbi:hypothetical protein PG995_013177 [Apiospora arundinis]
MDMDPREANNSCGSGLWPAADDIFCDFGLWPAPDYNPCGSALRAATDNIDIVSVHGLWPAPDDNSCGLGLWSAPDDDLWGPGPWPATDGWLVIPKELAFISDASSCAFACSTANVNFVKLPENFYVPNRHDTITTPLNFRPFRSSSRMIRATTDISPSDSYLRLPLFTKLDNTTTTPLTLESLFLLATDVDYIDQGPLLGCLPVRPTFGPAPADAEKFPKQGSGGGRNSMSSFGGSESS